MELNAVQEEMFMQYVEASMEGEEVESLKLEYSDDTSELDVYAVELESGRTFYLIADVQPLGLFAQGGICASAQDALDAYLSWQEEAQEEPVDRYSYY